GYRTIVAGTDGSVTANAAHRAALRLAKRLRAQVVVVCAYQPPRISRPMAEDLLGHALQAAAREGVTAIRDIRTGEPAQAIVGAIRLDETKGSRPEGVKTESVLKTGDPAQQLCLAAVEAEADLIVVGNKGMTGARRVLLGSVPNQVAHEAPTDVLIAKTVDR